MHQYVKCQSCKRNIVCSCQVAVRRWCRVLDALEIFAFDQALDLCFDHVDVGFELSVELIDYFDDETGVGELFALSVELC